MLWLLVRFAALPALHTRQRRYSANTNSGKEQTKVQIDFSERFVCQSAKQKELI